MMISPESYYEEYLKGKTKEQIMSTIRGLKQEIGRLTDLHIGEWRRRYTTQRFGYMVLDGTQWDLVFEYHNGHKPVRFDGDNAYPYNFARLERLFGIVDTEEEVDQ